MARNLPNLGLTAFFALGEDGWNDELDLNFLQLSVATQGVVEALVSVRPSSPTEGTVYLFSETETTQPNKVAIYDNATWKYLTPKNGWLFYDKGASTYRQFNGTLWTAAPLVDARIKSLAALDGTSGLINQTGASTFEKRAIGVSTSNDIISRGLGDARYAAINHGHSDYIHSFNTRIGDVTLQASDISTALTYTPQPQVANLTSLGALGTTLGLVEQTSAHTFAMRSIGAANDTDILSRAAGDARFAPSTPISNSLALLNTTPGIVEQTGASTFTKRKIDDINDLTSLVTLANVTSHYVDRTNMNFTVLNDVPQTYIGAGKKIARVKSTEDGLEFVSAAIVEFNTISTTTYSFINSDLGETVAFTNSGDVTVTVPVNTTLSLPIGSVITARQSGAGTVFFATGAGVTFLMAPGLTAQTSGPGATVRLVKHAANGWTLSGDLGHTVNIQVGSNYTLDPTDCYIRMDGVSACTILVPANMPVSAGTRITIYQSGTGTATLQADSGVILNGVVSTPAQFTALILVKAAANEWDIMQSG